jgi:hypothetical protein
VSDFEEAVASWARSKIDASDRHYESEDSKKRNPIQNVALVRVDRTDGWYSDSGTFWDGETVVVVRVTRLSRNKKPYSREQVIYAPDDFTEFLSELLEHHHCASCDTHSCEVS